MPKTLAAAAALLLALVWGALALAAHRRPSVDFQATLTPGQEVPPVRSEATGRMDTRLFPTASGGRIKWSLVFHHLSSQALGATIHKGSPGKKGPVLIRLCSRCRRPAGGTIRVTRAQANGLLHAPTYINLATTKHPSGEIRGRLHRHT